MIDKETQALIKQGLIDPSEATWKELTESKKKKKRNLPTSVDVEADMNFFNNAMGIGGVSVSEGKEKYPKVIKEGGVSRLYSKIKGKNTFAIIGSQDKDTREDRSEELNKLIKDYQEKHKFNGYNYIKGRYKYQDGSEGEENSALIYNISKQDALDMGKALNQETILWKDPDFFGYIRVDDGSEDMSFDGGLSFDKETIDNIGASSQLTSKGWHLNRNPKNKNTPYVFEAYLQDSPKGSGYACYLHEYLIDSYSSDEEELESMSWAIDYNKL